MREAPCKKGWWVPLGLICLPSMVFTLKYINPDIELIGGPQEKQVSVVFVKTSSYFWLPCFQHPNSRSGLT